MRATQVQNLVRSPTGGLDARPNGGMALWYNDERALLPPNRFFGRAVEKPLTTLHAHQSCGAVEVGNAVERETTAASPWLRRHAPFPLVPFKGNGRGEVHIRM